MLLNWLQNTAYFIVLSVVFFYVFTIIAFFMPSASNCYFTTTMKGTDPYSKVIAERPPYCSITEGTVFVLTVISAGYVTRFLSQKEAKKRTAVK